MVERRPVVVVAAVMLAVLLVAAVVGNYTVAKEEVKHQIKEHSKVSWAKWAKNTVKEILGHEPSPESHNPEHQRPGKAEEIRNMACDKAEEVKHAAAGKATDAKDATARKAKDMKVSAAGKASDAKDATAQKAHEMKVMVAAAAEVGMKWAKQGYATTKRISDEMMDTAKEKYNTVRKKMEELGRNMSEEEDITDEL